MDGRMDGWMDGLPRSADWAYGTGYPLPGTTSLSSNTPDSHLIHTCTYQFHAACALPVHAMQPLNSQSQSFPWGGTRSHSGSTDDDSIPAGRAKAGMPHRP